MTTDSLQTTRNTNCICGAVSSNCGLDAYHFVLLFWLSLRSQSEWLPGPVQLHPHLSRFQSREEFKQRLHKTRTFLASQTLLTMRPFSVIGRGVRKMLTKIISVKFRKLRENQDTTDDLLQAWPGCSFAAGRMVHVPDGGIRFRTMKSGDMSMTFLY